MVLTLGMTKSSSKWKRVEWRCSRMAIHRPLWCLVLVECRQIARVFDVEFDSYELDAQEPVKGQYNINYSIDFKAQPLCNRFKNKKSMWNIPVFWIRSMHRRMSMAQIHRTTVPAMQVAYWMALHRSYLCATTPNSLRRTRRKPFYYIFGIKKDKISNNSLWHLDTVKKLQCLTLGIALTSTTHYSSIWHHRNSCRFVPTHSQPVYQAKQTQPSNRSSERHDWPATRNPNQQIPMWPMSCRTLGCQSPKIRTATFLCVVDGKPENSQENMLLMSRYGMKQKLFFPEYTLPITYITMHQFPSEFLLCIFTTIHLIVSSNILVQCSQHNHSHHSGQEQYNDQAVQYAEPLDLCMRHRFQNIIPSRWPFDGVVSYEMHRIRVRDVDLLVWFQSGSWNGQRFICSATTFQFAGIVVFEWHWFDFNWNDTAAVSAKWWAPLFRHTTVIGDR